MRFTFGLLALLFVLGVSKVAHCLDDAERETAVKADVKRAAEKEKLDEQKRVTKNAGDELAKKLAALVTKLEEQSKSLGKTKDLPAAAADKDKLEAAAKALSPRPEVGDDHESGSLEKVWKELEKLAAAAVEKLAAPTTQPAKDQLKELEKLPVEVKDLKALFDALKEHEAKRKKLETSSSEADKAYQKAIDDLLEAQGPALYLSQRLRSARKLRCLTAYCWGGDRSDATQYAIEPVLDLPVGLVWAAGNGALPAYINSHTVNVEFNAGLRLWVAYDTMSIMVYFSRPLITGTDPIRLRGSPFEHPPSEVRRPFPSVGIGLAGDVLLIGISYDQLRNGSTDATRDKSYPANEVLSRSLTFSLGFSLFNTARNAAGAGSTPVKETP